MTDPRSPGGNRAEVIRHPLPEVRWPTAEEAAASLWFSPIGIGKRLVLASRSWVPAMVPWRATEDGLVTQDILDLYGRYARGRPGAIVVEATGIRDIKSGPLLRIGHDRFIEGLAELVATVRRESGGATRIFIQLIDFLSIRKRPEKERFLREFLELRAEHRAALAGILADPSWNEKAEPEVREQLLALDRESLLEVLAPREIEAMDFGARERITDVEKPHIRDLPAALPGLFASAAERARRAGFDGVELHYAHAYTMASFLSRMNTRSDGYGGSRANRVRLPLEVLAAVRDRVGEDHVVGCRFLGHEIIEGGSELEDAVWFGVELAKAGMDFLSVSTGGKFEDARQPPVGWPAYPYTGPSGLECMPTVRSDERGPFGRHVPLAAAIRAAVRAAGLSTPIVTAGGIHAFDQVEAILRNGEADICAAARQSLADPDWLQKIRAGKGHLVRRCVYTNYCEGLDQKHKEVTCQLWDREFTSGEDVKLAKDGKRRLTPPPWAEKQE